jgi:hypothetical protein
MIYTSNDNLRVLRLMTPIYNKKHGFLSHNTYKENCNDLQLYAKSDLSNGSHLSFILSIVSGGTPCTLSNSP